MNAHRSILAMPSARAAGLRPQPPTASSQSSIPIADALGESRLEAIRNRGAAKRLAWAMLGLCREAEQKGLDVTYWRNLAREIEGKIA